MKQIIIAIVIAVAVGIPTASAIGTYTISSDRIVGAEYHGSEWIQFDNGWQRHTHIVLIEQYNQKITEMPIPVLIDEKGFVVADQYLEAHEVSLEEALVGGAINPNDAPAPQKEAVIYSDEYLEKQKVEDISKLRKCLEEWKETNECGYERWLRSSNLEEFIIPEQEPQFDNEPLKSYPEIRKPALAWQACTHAMNYPWYSAQYNSIDMETDQDFGLDDFDSPHTQDVTEQDFKRSEENALRVMSVRNSYDMGQISGELKGEKYVPEFTVPKWYKDYKSHQDADVQEALDAAQVAICQYVDQYRNKIGTDAFPKWLEHCVE